MFTFLKEKKIKKKKPSSERIHVDRFSSLDILNKFFKKFFRLKLIKNHIKMYLNLLQLKFNAIRIILRFNCSLFCTNCRFILICII